MRSAVSSHAFWAPHHFLEFWDSNSGPVSSGSPSKAGDLDVGEGVASRKAPARFAQIVHVRWFPVLPAPGLDSGFWDASCDRPDCLRLFIFGDSRSRQPACAKHCKPFATELRALQSIHGLQVLVTCCASLSCVLEHCSLFPACIISCH